MDVRIQLGSVRRKKALFDLIEKQFREQGFGSLGPRLESSVDAVLRDPTLGFFLLARVDEVVIGLAYVSVNWALEHSGRSCWLEELYVLPEHRGHGIGRLLLRAAMRRARSLGCQAMDLEVDRGQARSQNLYEREGFRSLPRVRFVKKLDSFPSSDAA